LQESYSDMFLKKTKGDIGKKSLFRNCECSVEFNDKSFGVSSKQGARSTMEDTYNILLFNGVDNLKNCSHSDLEDGAIASPELDEHLAVKLVVSSEIKSPQSIKKISFFLVCDGHGGIEAANYVKENLFQNIIRQPTFDINLEKAILDGFEKTESSFENYVEVNDMDGMVGTTVTAALIVDNILCVANLGDSDAVICFKDKVEKLITQTHIPNNDEERKRVESVGGIIVRDRIGNYRLGHPNWNPNFVNIGVTRAIGDLYFKSRKFLDNKVSGLTAIPTISKWVLTVNDQFLIIASDGFWDVVSHKEANKLVSEKVNLKMDLNIICEELIQLCFQRNSKDNATVMIIRLDIQQMDFKNVLS